MGTKPSDRDRSITSKLTCTTSQERMTAMMGFPLADVFLASASARPAGKTGRLDRHKAGGSPKATN